MNTNLVHILNTQKIYTGEGFNEITFLALVSVIMEDEGIYFNTSKLKSLQALLNTLCRKHGLVGTTTKLNPTLLEFKCSGPIYSKKPVLPIPRRNKRRIKKQLIA